MPRLVLPDQSWHSQEASHLCGDDIANQVARCQECPRKESQDITWGNGSSRRDSYKNGHATNGPSESSCEHISSTVDMTTGPASTDDALQYSTSSIASSVFSTPRMSDTIGYESDGTVGPDFSNSPEFTFHQQLDSLRIASPNLPCFGPVQFPPPQTSDPQPMRENQMNTFSQQRQVSCSRSTKRKSISMPQDFSEQIYGTGAGPQPDRPTKKEASPVVTGVKRIRKDRSIVRRFACPFVKHHGQRYENVHNSCTHAPGLDSNRILEHVDRVHTPRYNCIYCGRKWSNTTHWQDELIQHLRSGQCIQESERLGKPECITAVMDKQIRQDIPGKFSPEERWTALYMALFPGEWPIPNPGYDFLVPRHKVQEPLRSNALPVVFTGAGEAFNAPQNTDFCFRVTNSLDLEDESWVRVDLASQEDE